MPPSQNPELGADPEADADTDMDVDAMSWLYEDPEGAAEYSVGEVMDFTSLAYSPQFDFQADIADGAVADAQEFLFRELPECEDLAGEVGEDLDGLQVGFAPGDGVPEEVSYTVESGDVTLSGLAQEHFGVDVATDPFKYFAYVKELHEAREVVGI